MTTRRQRGDGAVYPDRRSGLWTAPVELPPDGTGRRRRRTFRAKNRADVVVRLREAQTHLDKGLPVTDGTSTGQWLDHWCRTVLPLAPLAAATVDNYRRAVRIWITPYIAPVPLRQLEVDHVEGMMAALAERGLGATVGVAGKVLRRSLADGMRGGKIHRNVAALTAAPGVASTRLDDALGADQVARVLDTAGGDRLGALAVLMLGVGVRQGEPLRLRWEDLDLDRATLTVRPAKIVAGRRSIALTPFVAGALRRHRPGQAAERLAAPA
jgi:integrase